MALVLADRVLETTTTAGSGTITLAGAEPGYQSFSAVGDGNQTYYTITTDSDWEVGIGTYTASGTTLSRDTVLASSNSGNRVTLPAGSKKVFVTYPAEKSVNFDVSGNITALSGVITNVGYPSADSDAATKLYVDSLAEFGITYHAPVKYEVPSTTGNLTATYNNGTAGVSATLTNAGTLAAFVPDGVTASISDRVLVYSQTNAFENGVYTVTVVGNGSTAWVLTRATDADTYALKSPNSLGGGDAFFVTSGDTGAGETYICNNSGVISFGSTAISFVQISSAQVYKAGNGISLTNTTISLDTPVAVANGGTGSSATPTNGQLLIGNGSNFTLSTLTAGSGVSITNSAGSITLTATGLGGTVTNVTASAPLASSGGTTPNISVANSTGTGSVVLDQGATISSATITAGVSASITTITGTSANITTVSGTTARFSSGAITQLSGTSAGITTVTGTTTSFSSGTITQFGATSATIGTVSGTNLTYTNGNMTSATVTTVSGTTATYTSGTITTLKSTSATIDNLSSTSANITRLSIVDAAAPKLNLIVGTSERAYIDYTESTSLMRIDSDAAIGINTNNTQRIQITSTGLVGIGKTPTTTLDVSGTVTGINGAFTSANITTLTGTTATYTSATVTNLNVTSVTLSNLSIASANVTTLTGTNLTYTSGTITTLKSTSATIDTIKGTSASITTITGSLVGNASTATTASSATVATTAVNVASGGQINAASATITTITGTSSNITTLTGTTVRYSSGTITNLAATSITVTNTPAFVGNGTLTMNVSGTGLSGSQTFTANQSSNATFTVTSNATNANTASTIVARDASGNFSAGTITATLNGNASTATNATSATNSTTTSQRAFTGDISTTGQGRFTGWYSGNASTAAAVEVGYSSGEGYVLAYSRAASTYYTLVIQGSSTSIFKLGGSVANLTAGTLQQGGVAVALTNSANITTLTGTTFGATATTQLRGLSGAITTLTGTTVTYTSGTITGLTSTGLRVTSANITTLTGTTFSDGAGNVRNIPSAGADKTSVYTLAITDIGEYVGIGTGGGINVPNGVFSTGNAISIFNNTTGDRTISLTITTAYIAGTDADKNSVTLATRGLATILFLSNSVCVISGNVT